MAQTMTTQVDVKIPASRLWKAFQDITLMPKVLPQVISNVENEGDGSVGTIRTLHFGPAVPHFSFMKERVDAIDAQNYSMTFTTIEGGTLGTIFSKHSLNTMFVPKDNGSTAVWTFDFEAIIPDPPLEQIKESHIQYLQAIEGYLLSNEDYA